MRYLVVCVVEVIWDVETHGSELSALQQHRVEVDECKQQLLILVLSFALCVTLVTDCVVQPCQVGSQALYQHVDITSGHTVDDSCGVYNTQSFLICKEM